MIGQTSSHFHILEKPRHKDGGQVGAGGPAPACAPLARASAAP